VGSDCVVIVDSLVDVRGAWARWLLDMSVSAATTTGKVYI
jgi:hypothetical protein